MKILLAVVGFLALMCPHYWRSLRQQPKRNGPQK